MPTYTLHYFDARGTAEACRQLLYLGGQHCTDKRYTTETWPAYKPKTPFGQMPVLEVDGKPLPQSFAIARYLARQFGYAGKNDFEKGWVDAIGDQIKDYYAEFSPTYRAIVGIEGDKAKLMKEAGKPARDKFYPIVEGLLKNNPSGYLAGDSLTWIDLVLADHVDILLAFQPDFLNGYPKVVEHRKKIHSDKKIKAYLSKRPKTKF